MKKKIFNRIYTAVVLCALCLMGDLLASCNDYLDVVPDNTQEVTALFNRKETAYNALATCYHYIPEYDNTYSVLGMSDEMIMNIDRVTNGKRAVLGMLNADNPYMSYLVWTLQHEERRR
jgi:hypothetical protein